MEKIEKLEYQIKQLNRDELSSFRNWFMQFDSDKWDKEIEEDILSGKLNVLAQEAILNHKSGRSKEI